MLKKLDFQSQKGWRIYRMAIRMAIFDMAHWIFYASRMAKKAAAKPTAASPRLKSSSLLDIRGVYFGGKVA